jgi:hypothetical protein
MKYKLINSLRSQGKYYDSYKVNRLRHYEIVSEAATVNVPDSDNEFDNDIDEEQNDKAEQSDNAADHDSAQQYQDKKMIAALCYSNDPHRHIFTSYFKFLLL